MLGISEKDGIIMRPALRYFGGKWMLAPWIIEHFPKHRIYVESYGGAASVLLRKNRSYAEIINDLDGEIVNYFKVLRDDPIAFENLVKNTPYSRAEFVNSYESTLSSLERARRTLIKSFMGFGSDAIFSKSGFRSDSNRYGTTPARDWHNFSENIPLVAERLRGVVIENKNALDVMSAFDGKETLHFLDPPYLKKTRSRGGYNHEMNDAEHLEMLRHIKTLEGMVILCGYKNDLYNAELGDWHKATRPALADGAAARTEWLWINPNAFSKQNQLDIFNYA